MARTGFVYHELYTWHDTGNYAGFMPYGYPLQPGLHFENPETKRRFKNLLDASGFIKQLTVVEPRHATREEIERFHTAEYVDSVKAMSDAHGGDARGSQAMLRRQGAPDLLRRVRVDGSYASAHDPRVLFGLGGGSEVLGLTVRWADGRGESFPPPPLGRYSEVRQGEGESVNDGEKRR